MSPIADPNGLRGTAETHAIALSGVPETTLWPLWNRAAESMRTRPLIADAMAVELVSRLDYDFAGHFGKPTVFHAIRARVCDDLIRAYLANNRERPVVVALGEGLETQLWRINDDRARWISVDLPEAIQTRQALLPTHPRASIVGCSALDPAWIDSVPAGAPPFIAASGLLMYFREADVRQLLERITSRFPGAEVFFDTITPYLSQKTEGGWRVTKCYTAPQMPWGIAFDELPAFVRSIDGLDPLSVQSYTDPFPERTRLYRLLSRIPAVQRRFACGLVHLRASKTHG